jgi:ATP-dependent RNA helicase DDX23/PRP28
MGGERRRRKIRRMNDKKFVFDWDTNEDTSKDFNPIYATKHEVTLYGRGHLAGIDKNDQMKQKADYLKRFVDDRRTDAQKDRAEYGPF